jgi:flavin-dependent dehydrogenase
MNRRLVSRFIDADEHVLQNHRSIVIDGIKIEADLLTVDKPALNRAMLGDAEPLRGTIEQGRYDRVIDATGVERAYLGPSEGQELIADLIQYRLTSSRDLGLWISSSSIGYEWCFPLGGEQYHLGFGDLSGGAADHDLLRHLDGIEHKVHCRCRSRLRLSSPFHSQPFVTGGKVVGIGESVGTVAPLGGDGNLYAMQCAEMLVEHWDDLDGYSESVLSRFDWMRKERLALERLIGGEMPSMGDIMTFVQHSRRAGFGMGPINAMKYFRKALQRDTAAPEGLDVPMKTV